MVGLAICVSYLYLMMERVQIFQMSLCDQKIKAKMMDSIQLLLINECFS
jgi:hypothetical protein